MATSGLDHSVSCVSRGTLYDLGIEPEMSLDDVAREMGLSREYVRKIEQKALKKILKALANRGLSKSDFVE